MQFIQSLRRDVEAKDAMQHCVLLSRCKLSKHDLQLLRVRANDLRAEYTAMTDLKALQTCPQPFPASTFSALLDTGSEALPRCYEHIPPPDWARACIANRADSRNAVVLVIEQPPSLTLWPLSAVEDADVDVKNSFSAASLQCFEHNWTFAGNEPVLAEYYEQEESTIVSAPAVSHCGFHMVGTDAALVPAKEFDIMLREPLRGVAVRTPPEIRPSRQKLTDDDVLARPWLASYLSKQTRGRNSLTTQTADESSSADDAAGDSARADGTAHGEAVDEDIKHG
eukprot:1404974-Amphidinium_carterae.2